MESLIGLSWNDHLSALIAEQGLSGGLEENCNGGSVINTEQCVYLIGVGLNHQRIGIGNDLQ